MVITFVAVLLLTACSADGLTEPCNEVAAVVTRINGWTGDTTAVTSGCFRTDVPNTMSEQSLVACICG